MLNSGGTKQLHTCTHKHNLTLPHIYTLEAIKYADSSTPVFERERQFQVSVLHKYWTPNSRTQPHQPQDV